MMDKKVKLRRIVIATGAIICLLAILYLTVNYTSFRMRVFNSEYVNVNLDNGMGVIMVFKKNPIMFTDPTYEAYIYVDHDWKNPIILEESEEYLGSDVVKIKALGSNECQITYLFLAPFYSPSKLFIWKKNGSRPAFGYRFEYGKRCL